MNFAPLPARYLLNRTSILVKIMLCKFYHLDIPENIQTIDMLRLPALSKADPGSIPLTDFTIDIQRTS